MNTELLDEIDNILNSLNTLQINLNNLRNKLINNSTENNIIQSNLNEDNQTADVDSFGPIPNLDLDISKLNIDDEKKSD